MSKSFNFNPDTYSDTDFLGFNKYINTLSSMIRDPKFKTPFCIGIYGKWGSGKTTFMHLLSDKLKDDVTEQHIIPVWFNPWRYSKEEHLIIPFLKTIEQAIESYIKDHEKIGKELIDGLREIAVKMGQVAAAFAYGINAECKLGEFGFTLDVSKAVDREEALAKGRIKEAKTLAKELSSIYYDIMTQLKNAVKDKPFRIAVFIDDLDRCLPEKAVELLEAIKLFLDIEGYLFVIGVAKEVVEKGIAYRYRFLNHNTEKESGASCISPEEYLDKMIQLPLELPPIEPGKKQKYVESLLEDDDYKKHADLIGIGVGDNPRALKRYVNLLVFMARLAEDLKSDIIRPESDETEAHKKLIKEKFVPLLYLKWSLIVFKFPQVHLDIKGNRKKIIELQDAAIGRVEEAKDGEAKKKAIEMDVRLKKILQKEPLFPDDDWLIARFVHLTEATIIKAAVTESASGYSQTFQSGDMVLIPKGKFLYGDDKLEKEIDYDYYMDVFPVTNQQYALFMEAGGYTNEECWSDQGWAWREKEKTVQPKYWNDDKWNQPDCPVVGVSWYEAEAFCKWRTQNEDKKYRLPTEEEWEKAARGTDGRKYPWGEEFDKEKCNTSESGLGKTTPVNNYPKGASPFKCRDMAGNVLEWTDSWYDEDKDTNVLRGGSWLHGQEFVRCAARDNGNPDARSDRLGFRLSRTKKG